MRPKTFGDFLTKKKRECLKQLSLLKQLLERSGFKVESYIGGDDDDEPYVFCKAPSGGTSFGGIRIYKIGTQLAFRIQKENKTHPYGSAYALNIEEMFSDFMSEERVDDRKAGEMVIEFVGREIRKFFEKSLIAEKEERESSVNRDKESSGNVMIKSTSGTDYSAMVFSKS